MTASAVEPTSLSAAKASDLAAQVVARCHELACITDVPGETTRTFLSAAMHRTNLQVSAWMREAGMAVRVDGAGNLRGMRMGSHAGAPPFVLASHLDTVPNAGAFDGVLGVLLAITLAGEFRDAALPFPLEVIAFSEEEGVRFGVPFIGSRGFVGTLDTTLLATCDPEGAAVAQALAAASLPAEAVEPLTPRRGYLEFHIEQGPVLDSEGLPLGIVESIAGQSRYTLTFTGQANHAGTTPMHLRHDAMSAAAAWVVEVERYAREHATLVATVGSLAVEPGAGNVIASLVRASLDLRSSNDATRATALAHLLAFAERMAGDRGVAVAAHCHMSQAAVPMDRHLLRLLEDAVDGVGARIRRMVSGAGHDAMIVAPFMPAAMLFLRSPGGVSHHPDEAVHTADVALALRTGAAFLQDLAAQEGMQ